MKLILTATDGSVGADRALKLATDLAVTSNAILHVVNVIEQFGPASETLDCYSGALRAPVVDELEAMSADILLRAKERALAQGVKRVETETRTGPAAATILEVAKDEDADMIVVGKRGRGRIAGLVLGSVSQKIACEAFCPVVIAP